MATILIAGGTGLIGTHLSKLLAAQDHQVLHLSREEDLQARFPAYHWDIYKGEMDERAIRQADYVINLAGAGIADERWTDKRKKAIIKSRTQGARLLKESFERYDHLPQAYLSASAVGYYGNRGDDLMTEDSKAGDGFLSESTQLWEAAIAEVANLGIRTVALRTGIVLSTQGGALEKMLTPLKFFNSVYFGDGQQWYSWIHIDDICQQYLMAIEKEDMQGTYNAVAPQPVRNKELAQTLADVNDAPTLVLPAPAFALKFAFGEMSHAILDSTRVSSAKIEAAGYSFRFPDLKPALQDLLERDI